ncbi:tail fiber domain-containing protein [Pseudoalteromonas luteoviolacea]|uniref:tail fiber domain-containing protein n=1 Tax=Pseudoalteromonas luteoviolacea TaxID=43657 RepID=UPI001B362825|nr:tail fiber domain-containing protein [Pseudoalteromonas luteoviolacea]MBQ4812894.1 tail fiber domain-containing protein [Pseudoalteromonas luteoviolacea]
MKHSELNTELRGYFENGDIPTEDEFRKLIDASTDNRTTFSLVAHIFGMVVDCAITEPLADLSEDLAEVLAQYQLVSGESVLLYLQDNPQENGVYTFGYSHGEGGVVATLTKQVIDEFDGMLIKANRSKDNDASYYHYVTAPEEQSLQWEKVENFDVPDFYASSFRNARFPEVVDLTQGGMAASSVLTAGRIVGNGNDITNLNNASLPAHIDLTVIADDSKVKAKYFEGNGNLLTSLNANELKGGQVPPDMLDFAEISDMRDGSSVKVLNADHGQWLDQKMDRVANPLLSEATIVCVETEANIDLSAAPSQIDGITLQAGDLVLLTAQSNAAENCIWQYEANAKFVEPDPAHAIILRHGYAVEIHEGARHQHKVFVLLSRFENADGEIDNQWQATAQITLAGMGIQVTNNQHAADIATSADVEAERVHKLLDAALFKQKLNASEQGLTADYTAKINEQKDRIDSILHASDADADSFKEIVDLINSIDTESDAAFATYVLENDARSQKIEEDLDGEITTRQQQVAGLQSSLQLEVSTRIAESTNRYTKAESDQRFLKSLNTKLVGQVNITEATFNGDLNVTGAITATKDVTAFSDERLKADIKPIENALEIVNKLDGVTFERSDFDDNRRYTGLIAQQVKGAFPEAVHQEGEYYSVAYGNLVGLLVESIKELNGKVASLQSKLVTLESK